MKRILCFGDSITWGYNPANATRFDFENTWPGVMELALGSGYRVITEALTGRTTCWELPYAPFRNSGEYLPMLLESHTPLDLVILMLGINDLMKMVGKTAAESAWGLLSLIRPILSPLMGGQPPRILIIAPPAIGRLSEFNRMAFEGMENESVKLANYYRAVAKETWSDFLDANEFMKASDIDGLHPLLEDHRKLGEAVAKKILEIMN